MKNPIKWIALVLVFSVLAFSAASCVGKFALTNKLYQWNKSIDKWLGSIVLIVFIIVPVYGVTLLIDWIILNVIEFYGGNNPVASNGAPVTKTAVIDGRQVDLKMYPGETLKFDLTTVEPDGSVKVLFVRSDDKGVNGRLVSGTTTKEYSAAHSADGGIDRLADGTWEHISPERAALALDRFTDSGLKLADAN